MKTFELEGQEYTLPEGWHEVSVELFEKLAEHSLMLSEYKSQLQFSLEMLSILLGLEVEKLKRLNKASFDILSDSCEWANQKIVPSGKKEFSIENEIYEPIKDLNSLTMGEQIDLEILLNDAKPFESLSSILPILVRRMKTIVKEGQEKRVRCDYDAEEFLKNKELFKKHLMVADVINLKDSFFFGAIH